VFNPTTGWSVVIENGTSDSASARRVSQPLSASSTLDLDDMVGPTETRTSCLDNKRSNKVTFCTMLNRQINVELSF
jgi:hypothetical protein